jgi:hypothetical protein
MSDENLQTANNNAVNVGLGATTNIIKTKCPSCHNDMYKQYKQRTNVFATRMQNQLVSLTVLDLVGNERTAG